jgi:hypothetical protein
VIYITTDSPERAWEPFLDWLREHDIDPHWCYQVGLGEGEDPECVAYLFAADENGKRYLAPGTDTLATRPPHKFIARRPAPRRYHQ